MIPRILDFLREQHPFTLLTEAERERVDATASARSFADGARILEQDGTRSDCLYLLVDGQVRLVRDGEELQVLEEGDCFGYPSMINRAAPAFDVVAAGEVQVHCVPEAVFRELLGNAAFAEFFLHSLGERLQRVTGASVTALGGELTTELGDIELRAVVQVPPDATVAEAARAMRDARDDFALVAGTPPGIVTDHDFQVKVLAEGLGPDTPVAHVMTRPLKTLPSDTPVHGALLYMLEERIHHLPVLREGEIIGVLTATDLLRHQTTNPLYLMRRVEHLDRDTTLATYSRDAAAMVERLFRGGLKVGQIGRVFASLNDALIRRLCRLAEVDLGPPPCAYAWLVFGSEGRMEQALLTDQDNALVYARDDAGAPEYFARLAARVVGDLVTAGFPPCPGGCMATNWNKPLAAWEETIRSWIDEPTPDNLMVSSIFFDYRAVAGTLDVAALDDRITAAAGNQLFMAHLARVSLRFKPPLGLFQQIQATDDKVDLKKRSIAPIVAAARVYGLEAGTRARPTRERLEAAIEAGVVSRDLGQTLIETYRFLLQLRLREQLAAVAGGGAPDNDVNLKALSSLQRRHLKDAFGVIREMQGAVARRYRTSALG
ncbi:MAG: cyclic nucleotide-binding/CBS domain-containing protein [bacterium]|nr:cyclic nucleotide-binding/CBS domain-containing protein [bacterium]